MDAGASGAASLAHFFIFPPVYSEKSRFRDAAAVPHFFFFFWGAHLKKNTYFCRNRLISKQKGVFLQKWAILGLFGEVSHTQTEISQKSLTFPGFQSHSPLNMTETGGMLNFLGFPIWVCLICRTKFNISRVSVILFFRNLILTAGMLNFFAFNSKSASGWGNVKHVKHVKLSGTYSGLAHVSSKKFNMFNMFSISPARSRFWILKQKSLTFPLWELHFAPNPGNAKLFALLQHEKV